jgi:hypothetical protein
MSVDPTDIGKVIGKSGRTARSLRSITNEASLALFGRDVGGHGDNGNLLKTLTKSRELNLNLRYHRTQNTLIS